MRFRFRDSSEKSWSDNSEKNKSWSSRSDKSQANARSKPNFNKKKNYEKFEHFESKVEEYVDYAESNASFKSSDLTGSVENIAITWFHNPLLFYCQILNTKVTVSFLFDALI